MKTYFNIKINHLYNIKVYDKTETYFCCLCENGKIVNNKSFKQKFTTNEKIKKWALDYINKLK